MEIKDEAEDSWRSLSASLSTSYARKKNLIAGQKYLFRVRAKKGPSEPWSAYSAESVPLTVLPVATKQAAAPPRLSARDSVSVSMQWDPVPGATGYRVRFRRDDQPTWDYITATVTNAAVKKKNLLPGTKYIFSVAPVVPGEEWEYGLGSTAVGVAVLSQHLVKILPRTLKTKTGSIATSDALAGKVVCFYFSASWCGPCRSFTPQLAQLYGAIKAHNKDCEIVFVSADHSAEDFDGYWSGHHPWPAIAYDEGEREPLMSMYNVRGIPRLLVLGPQGNTLVDNAVQSPMNLATVDGWIRMAHS